MAGAVSPGNGPAPAGIAVGGDAIHSVLITGDYNRVYLTPAQATALPEVQRRLRMLAVIAAPASGPQPGMPPGAPLNVWAEWRALAGGIQQAADAVTGDAPAWAVVRLSPPTPARLRAAMAAGDGEETAFQVAHFICHGSPQGLALETGVGREMLLPAGDLVAAFRRGRVHIAFLNGCETLAVAQALHERAGVRCVVGAEESIYDSESCVLARVFYGMLARGAPAGEALEEAQAALVDAYVSDDGFRALAHLSAPVQDPATFYRRFGQERAAILHLVGDPDTRLEPPQDGRGADPLFLAAQPPLPDWDMVARFVGRGEERVRLASWLSGRDLPRPRAVFGLTGVGGIGKTALALAAAAREGYRFGNRVVFVTARERAGQFSLEEVYGAVAAACGMGLLPADPRQRGDAVVAVLNDPARPCLLILDNLEELSQAQAAELAVFLRRLNPQSGRSAALLTLRPDEKPPLDELIHGTRVRLDDLTEPDGLRLAFDQVMEKRVWAQVPERALGQAERQRVERAARFAALEQLPLCWLASLLDLAEAAAFHPVMIRLAVGQVFGTHEWEDTLFIVRGLEPQRNVQAAVLRLAGKMLEDLLDPDRTGDETLRREGLRVLQALAVFVGGATRRALQVVAWGEDVPDGPLKGLGPEERRARLAFENLLDGLVGRNLARRAEGRYDLHSLIHACLRDYYPPDAEEEVALRLRHAQVFLPVVADYDDSIRKGRMRYDAPMEWADVVAAMDWMSADAQPGQPVVQQVLVAYSRHWRNTLYNNYHPRRLRWLEAALAAARALHDRDAEANVLKATGDVLAFLDRRDEALARYEEALTLSRAVGSRLGEANVYFSLGQLSLGKKDLQQAVVLLERAAHLYEEIGAQAGLANVSIALARLAAAQGDFCAAVERIQPAIDFTHRIGHPLEEALGAEQEAWRQMVS